jgi:hypothetical protein
MILAPLSGSCVEGRMTFFETCRKIGHRLRILLFGIVSARAIAQLGAPRRWYGGRRRD